MSLEAAAALMCKLGCLTELLQSSARANVPTDLKEIKQSINSACKTSININTQPTLFEISRLHFSVTTLHGLAPVLSQRPASSDVVCYYERFTLLSSYDQRGLGVGGETVRDSRITNREF